MSEPTDQKISRPALEQHLLELTGFKADSAEITAHMYLVDAYVTEQLMALNLAPSPVIESQQHLLIQQAELLLDSAPGLGALSERISELVAAVNQVTGALYGRLRELEGDAQERAGLLAAITERIAELESAAVQPVIELTDEEREAVREALGPSETELDELMTDDFLPPLAVVALPAPATAFETSIGMLACSSCGLVKGPDEFFRNAKSATGREGKCKECRKKMKAA